MKTILLYEKVAIWYNVHYGGKVVDALTHLKRTFAATNLTQ